MTKLWICLLLLLVGTAASPPVDPGEGYVETPDGVHLFYKIVGHGPKMVAVHGGPANSLYSIEPDFAPLAAHYTIIYYDQRGNGRSDLIADPSKLSLENHIADLDAIRAHFGLEKMKLLGNSWGGLLVAAYAAAHPDRIERLVMHDPAGPTKAFLVAGADELTARAQRRLDPARRRRLGQFNDSAYRERARDPRAVCREWAALLLPLMTAGAVVAPIKGDICGGSDEAVRIQQRVNAQIWETMGDFDLRTRMAAVKAPVLVIRGEEDYVPLEAARAWTSSMPNARLLPIPGAGHIPQGEQPQIFFPAVRSFLEGGWPAAARPVRGSSERTAPPRRDRNG